MLGTVPNSTVHVPITTGTVIDRGSVYTDLLGAIGQVIYRISRL
jgi:hypothetical protein